MGGLLTNSLMDTLPLTQGLGGGPPFVGLVRLTLSFFLVQKFGFSSSFNYQVSKLYGLCVCAFVLMMN